MKVKLGCEYRDIVTGIQGIAVAKYKYLNGCDRICLQPQGIGEKGEPFKQLVCDELDLVFVSNGVREALKDLRAKRETVAMSFKEALNVKPGGPQRYDPE